MGICGQTKPKKKRFIEEGIIKGKDENKNLNNKKENSKLKKIEDKSEKII